MRLSCILIFFLVIFVSLRADAQENTGITDTPSIASPVSPLIVSDIRLSGNKRTKAFIVLRELPFQKGESIEQADVDRLLVLARQQVMNTLLFVEVQVYVAQRRTNEIEINVDLKERWYFFPLPYFRLADRNFNQWWVEQKASLDRVNYGIKFTQYNTTGRNDALNVWLITGYTNQVTLRYNLPFFEKTLKHGFNIGALYASQKEVNYATGDNKQLFFKLDEITKKALRFELTYSYRPDVRNRHYFRVSYNDESVADTVLKINPVYYPGSRTRLTFLDFNYQYRYYNVDYIPYPTRGFQMEGNLYNRAPFHDISFWQASARAVYAIPIRPATSFFHLEGMLIGKLKTENWFYNQRMFGYGFLQLRGLEYNVVDGHAGAALKTTFHQQVFSFVIKNLFNSKTHDRIPVRFFLKAYGDMGYAYNPYAHTSNTLNNTFLRTWGVGLDIVSIYDFVFRIEYSFNQLGREGLYLQTRNNF
jgi:outer membrane protein assembly factor BamA